jgi:TM2 domain-containing membrane protein YozV
MSLLARFNVLTKIIGVIALMAVMIVGGIWFATGRMAQINDGYSTFLSKDAQAWVTAPRVARISYQLRYLAQKARDGGECGV